MKGNPNVVVVGRGIMGASAAWHLARKGANVTLIVNKSATRAEATASSFGWIGTGARLPSDNPSAFVLHLEAVREFARLEQDLRQLPIAVHGALIWWHTEEATAAFLAEQQAAGIRMEAVTQRTIADREPRLAIKPPLAAWAPDDFAIEPADLASQLIAAAVDMGTKVHCGTAEAIETTNGRATGVRVGADTIAADVVVLANGYGARSLAAQLGIDLPILESPAVLLRFGADAGSLRHLLCGSQLEVRPTLGGGLSSAADFPENGENGLPALAAQTAFSISHLLGLPFQPTVLSINAAQRPMTEAGKPLRGFVAGVEGLYALVAHPGVTFAPLLGRIATLEIMNA